jgi:hypothetical protein
LKSLKSLNWRNLHMALTSVKFNDNFTLWM